MKVTRELISYVTLPERDSAQEVLVTTRADITDAVEQIRKNLDDYASRYTHLGWVISDDGWRFDVVGQRVTGWLKIERDE